MGVGVGSFSVPRPGCTSLRCSPISPWEMTVIQEGLLPEQLCVWLQLSPL